MNRVVLMIAFSTALTACQGHEPTEPGSPAGPPSPVRPAEPQAPGTPPNPAGPSASIVPAGIYRVYAPITSFDPVWGDLTGYRYAATFAVQHHATDGSRLVGTFSDFMLIDAEGQHSSWSLAGTLEGFVDDQGRVTFDLKNFEGNFTWWGRGAVTTGRIEGSWGRAGHLAGPFSAVLSK